MAFELDIFSLFYARKRAVRAYFSNKMTKNKASFLIAGTFCSAFLLSNSASAELVEPSVDLARASTGIPWFGYIIPLLGVFAMAFTVWKSKWIAEKEVGTDTMADIAKNITDGAMSFLKAEYSVLAVFVAGRVVIAVDRAVVCLRSILFCLSRIHRHAGGHQSQRQNHQRRSKWIG